MANAAPIPGLTGQEVTARRRRWKKVKVAFAFLPGLLLFYAGYQGKQHAELQARLDQVGLVRAQLQQKLDDEQPPVAQLVGKDRGTNAYAGRMPASNPQVQPLVNTLRAGLAQFDSEHSPGKLTGVEDLEVRLSKATLANAERRFADALTTLRSEDEQGKGGSSEPENSRLIRVLQVRAGSYYGLQQWQDALERYRRMLILQPNRIPTMARVAECQFALGRLSEASATFEELAKRHNDRGDALLVQGKPDAALGHYEQVIEIETWLMGKEWQSELAGELAKSHQNAGNALLLQEKPYAAIGHYEKAIEIQTRLMGQEGHGELADDLAMCHNHLANALFGAQKLDAAAGHYEKAVEMQTRLLGQEGSGDQANDLAMCHNNLGVLRRAQGQLEAAIGSFGNAVSILTRFIEKQSGADGQRRDGPELSPVRLRVKLDVTFEFSEKAVEVSARIRLPGSGGRKELRVALAIALKNRGYAYLVQGKLDSAVVDFKKALEIYSTLVEQEGQKELASQLVGLRSTVELYKSGRK